MGGQLSDLMAALAQSRRAQALQSAEDGDST
jgi:hypothetical protein